MQIAAKYPDDRRNEYTEAAATLRAPYWDWATARAIPEATVPESVTVTTAEGKKQIKNPLSSYPYPQEALQGQYGDMNRMRPEARQQKTTYRCASPQSYPDSANDALSLRRNQVRTNDLRAMLVSPGEAADGAPTRANQSTVRRLHQLADLCPVCLDGGKGFQPGADPQQHPCRGGLRRGHAEPACVWLRPPLVSPFFSTHRDAELTEMSQHAAPRQRGPPVGLLASHETRRGQPIGLILWTRSVHDAQQSQHRPGLASRAVPG